MTDYLLGDNPKLVGYWPLNDDAEGVNMYELKYGIAYVDDGAVKLQSVSINKDEWRRIKVLTAYPWVHTEG